MISIDNNSNNVNKNMEEKQVKKDEVKLLMKQNQVKQWEVAEAMGISEFTLCRWLRKDLKGKQLERLNSAIKKVRSMLDAFIQGGGKS
jgi:predicted XRE-type DNA-binding protein